MMYFFRKIFLQTIVCCSCFFTFFTNTVNGQSKYDTLTRNRVDHLFYFYLDQQFEHKPMHDSARLWHNWDSARRWIDNHHDDKMRWYNELFLTVFQSYKLEEAGKADTFLLARRAKFENSPYPEIKASWFFFLAHHFYTVKKFELSFRFFLLSIDLMEQIGYRNMPLVNHYRYYFFQLHYQVGDYPAALRFYMDIRKDSQSEGDGRAAFDYNNIGMTYLKMGNLAMAKNYFNKSVKYAQSTNDTIFWGIAVGNYGNALRLQGHYREALPYLYFDLATNQIREPPNSAITSVYIANSLLHMDSIGKAETYLKRSLTLQPNWEWSSFGIIYFETKALYFKKTGNYEKASAYQDSLITLRDRLKAQNNVALFKEISEQFHASKYQAREKQKAIEEKDLRRQRVGIIAVLFFLFSIVFFLLQKKHGREKKRLLEQQLHDSEALKLAEERLEKYLHEIRQKNLEAEITDIKESFSQFETFDEEEQEIKLQQLNGAVLITEDSWNEFKVLFIQVYPSFFEDLHTRYPLLTPAETRLLALCKLQVSSRDMAGMQGISQESLRKARYRLRKKYPALSEEDDFKISI